MSELSRREFLRYAAASAALAGVDGCTRLPARNILPYVDNRPELTPGVAQRYATAMSLDGYATGLVVTSHSGRPTKIEGNPDHPASLGASGAIEQASVLDLYDPHRGTHARGDWQSMLSPSSLRGRSVALLVEPTSSPLDEEWLARVLETHPTGRVYMYAPLADLAPQVAHYDLSAADVILAVDSDFLASGPFHLRYARQFADKRRLRKPGDPMNRLYVIESTFTPTGAAADHRFAVRPHDVAGLLNSLMNDDGPEWLAAIARDLKASAGRSLVITADPAGDAINATIGAAGRTTWYAPSPLIGSRVPIRPFAELISALQVRAIDTLVIVGGNPVYATPGSMEFGPLLRNVAHLCYVGLYENETAREARCFVPMSHYLEAWGNVRAYDGTLSIVQPLVNPLYKSVSAVEVYATMAGVAVPYDHGYTFLRQTWKAGDDAWNAALQRGVVEGTSFGRTNAPASEARSIPAASGIDVIYVADHKVHDGTFANNGWLQELPAPLTQLTWGNAALISPATAKRAGVGSGDAIVLSSGARRITVPALIVPGHADDTVTLNFGYGQHGIGVDVYRFWPALGARWESGVTIARAVNANVAPLNITQTEPNIGVNHPARSATLAAYRAAPDSVGVRSGRALTLYEPNAGSAPNQWAMTIDLGTCIGCGACMVACQAENNVPVVGMEEVRRGRGMHWLRIDRYFVEREHEIEALMQPMLCQQCEKAPCEYVCPVEATAHSDDGLNDMVYNRCVGTRFCSNNCPYKVRRFNWYDYNADLSETELMVKNPNVTVRERGVMEKCTFCVQRIREGEIAAARDGRPAHVQTACQQACPTQAIVFGSLTDATSEVVARRNEPRAYAALHELGTEPRVRYLARIRNTNPELGPR